MNDEIIIKRGWVKNAAIIFLAVMLVLTFFSNTILNHSLPEVAVATVQSGAISTRIRGTGTVEATATYEVMLQQSREVKSVMVKAGDLVEPGQVMFVLAEGEGEELEAARDELDALQLAYQKALINASDADYAKDDRAIAQTQAKLSEAMLEMESNHVFDEELERAKEDVADAEEELAELGGGGEGGGSAAQLEQEREIVDGKAELNAAKNGLAEKALAYRHLIGCSFSLTNAEGRKLLQLSSIEIEKYSGSDLLAEDSLLQQAIDFGYCDAEAAGDELAQALAAAAERLGAADASAAYQVVLAACEGVIKANNDLLRLYENIDVDEDLVDAQQELADATEHLAELEAKSKLYEAAKEQVETLQDDLSDKMFALQEAQKADGKEQSIEALDLAADRKKIQKLRDEIAELAKETVNTEVTAPVAGLVRELNITAGQTTTGGQAMATIEVPDMGYSLSFSVTREQAAKVKVGDTAEVSSYYWGPSITAKLVGIKTDKDEPTKNKLLVFALEGEVDSGAELSVSVGQKSANYDLVLPNSAIREDSKGSFVLLVQSKPSPLGERYKVQRADVNVLASDDTSTAVSGGVANWDYVVTTSSAPIEAGQQVRLAD